MRRIGSLIGSLALVSASFVGVSAQPAQATGSGAGFPIFAECSSTGLHCVSGSMSGKVERVGNLYVVQFECTVTGIPTASSTAITACNIGSGRSLVGLPFRVPGPGVATSGVATFTTDERPEACVGGSSNFAETALGASSVSGGRCEPLIGVFT